MSQTLSQKARNGRVRALATVRMPHVNLFWDGETLPPPNHSMAGQMTDARIRMGRWKAALQTLP